ncbi:hypothetical protein HPE56_14110 [Maribacter sp. ANRC-HE7]|uniref:DUF1593 domain-containing protein n=1 Tax=Maribacter aquimaris TaxID=2737171 RepID=A0ABR7V2T5_9FLAO|nr:hypothetical protein [Maribacter aquimaris]MBD0778931.1 hypothetical protein [Maribacter aquimaris]
MKSKSLLIVAMATTLLSFTTHSINTMKIKSKDFNIKKDLLLVQLDCKTDVDDLHTAAALATLVADSDFSKLKYHAVAGTYGIQEGLYVPPNDLMQLSFGNNWTDAHKNRDLAVQKVKDIVKKILRRKGDVWIAEAGQSDFTAELVKAIQQDLPKINTLQRIHVVQHSDWNEKSTSPKDLDFVKKNTDYWKIPDGNAVGNGTPGFRDADYTNWKDNVGNPKLKEIWGLSTDLSNQYNGKDGRYNNHAVSAGGLDFSDLSEVCSILGIGDIKDVGEFFDRYGN